MTGIKYAGGGRAYQGDKVTLTATGEHGYLRVLGVRGYVTVMFGDIQRPDARVVHISEITKDTTRRAS